MSESDVEQYAVPTPRAKMLRRFRRGALLGMFMSVSILLCSAVTYIQEVSDRTH